MGDFVSVALNLPVSKPFTYELASGVACGIGHRIEVMFRNRKKIGYVVGVSKDPPAGDFKVLPVLRVIDESAIFSEELLEVAVWIATFYFCSVGEALHAMLPSGKREAISEDVQDSTPAPPTLELSDEQRSAVEGILARSDGISYVQGVTGSGKTEVFLRVAEATLKAGRSVIYLVPEIALTHQLVEHLTQRFGISVGVIHSRLTKSQRLAEWRRIAAGEATFAVGARSAVFSPTANLGLCVIDEEHEGSYKSGQTPRYHARQVAMKRAAIAGARVVMGSATPSAEAIHQMATGAIRRFFLSRRLAGGSMPEITIIDMKQESGPLSTELKERILAVHAVGRQSILFLNRRGFSYFFHCRSCEYEMTCRQCSASLTYHKSHGRMVCHYCGYSESPIALCPECGSLDVGYSGFGTEKIEEALSSNFPELRIRRLDSDSVQKRGVLQGVLAEFRDRKIDLLVGTQMVAKGLNFPGVKLVGIVNADTGLNIPDFRAEERAFSLIVQVSGRAGRFIADGEVIIQTSKPGNAAIRFAAAADLEGFYERELSVRRELGFPPFGRLIRIVFRGRSLTKVSEAARLWGEFLVEQSDGDPEVLGPCECALAMVSGNHRLQIILRSQSMGRAHRLVSRTESLDKPSGVYVEIDVDPVALM